MKYWSAIHIKTWCCLLPRDAFFSVEFRSALTQRVSPAGASLNPDLYSFHRSQSDVGKELCTGRGSQVDAGAIRVRLLLRREGGREGVTTQGSIPDCL